MLELQFTDTDSPITEFEKYWGFPDCTIFVLPGNRTIAKIILSGDCFITKIVIYDFSRSPFLDSFSHV